MAHSLYHKSSSPTGDRCGRPLLQLAQLINIKKESPCLIHIAAEEWVERSHSPSLNIGGIIFDKFSR